ncbi:alpha-amylase [bacterium]|nr:alpha-amylase [candidate division CSSED10-310 bacterium]
MSFRPDQFDLIRIRRAALDRYSLHSVFHHRLSDSPEHRMHWAHSAALNINTVRAAGNDGAPPVAAGRLHAVTLLSEAYLRLMTSYEDTVKPDFIPATITGVIETIGTDRFNRVCSIFLDEFPTGRLHRHVIGAPDYLECPIDGSTNASMSFQSMIVTWLHSRNPALVGYEDLFRMSDIASHSPWEQWIGEVDRQWKSFPPFGRDGESLMAILLAPMLMAPDSIDDQLRYIAEHWREILGEFAHYLLRGADTIREENKPAFAGPGPAIAPIFIGTESEPEAYSDDIDWMPSVVLLAKNTYVWLEQLTREFGFPIDRLDRIPDDALFQLARRGFTGLWLIGLWARSPASRRIKQMCGNPEAVASAYSIYDYRISDDLGGEDAFRILKDKAATYGIKLAGDMVPNHMGIDSWWVCEHPDWFISTDNCPYPQYSFNGVNLSSDSRSSIFLEDHYFSRSDAAVVFKYIDNGSGRTRFIYHGNDGTGLPWNDTAQLDFLRQDVRDQVVKTIVDVAKKFPIIRFDAAMTLAKKHFHRLWYPEPGEGGDIASRSWFGLSRQDFDERMPVEFWREVVEQVAQQVPDTLLLAEAFWLMEGYFVRTLGMHRVYNSAFMNMLSREDNQQYRDVIKNTIEFDPEILKRYVNFMNNPDEEPAVVQFGKGDKYFGVCAMMCTLPGLPMFGHGQFEGYTEKYGMEYRRSYWNETPDIGLISHHERIITPLLKHRRLFSGAAFFRLFDFVSPDLTVNENVFAYSNQYEGQHVLFIFNNSSHPADGSLRMSAAWRQKINSDEGELYRISLSEALPISGRPDKFVLLFDLIQRKWRIRRSSLLTDHGFSFQLSAYQCHAFVDIQEVDETTDRKYETIEHYLQGGSTASIEDTWLDLKMIQYHQAIQRLSETTVLETIDRMTQASIDPMENDIIIDFDELEKLISGPADDLATAFSSIGPVLPASLIINELLDQFEHHLIRILDYRKVFSDYSRIALIWNGLINKTICELQILRQIDPGLNVRIWRLLERSLLAYNIEDRIAGAAARITDCLVNISCSKTDLDPDDFLRSEDVRNWIQVNRYRDTDYFNRESFEELLEWCRLWSVLPSDTLLWLSIEARRLGYRYKEFLDARISNK